MKFIEFVKTSLFGEIKEIKKYPSGQQNTTYKLNTSKGKFSLRIYSYKKCSQIEFEVALLNHCRRLKVLHLIKLNSSFIKTFNNKPFVVYKYLPGKQLKNFTKKQLKEIGEFIADFHNQTRNFKWNKHRYQFYNLPDWKIKQFEKFIRKKKVKHLSQLPKIIDELKQNRLSRNLPRGPIHNDIKPENVLFYKNKLSGVIDFDNSSFGPLVADLAKSMVWFGLQKNKFNLNQAMNIYQGYIGKKKLTTAEKDSLYKAIKFSFLSHIFVDYYMMAKGVLTNKYFEFIATDFYQAYKTFNLNEKEFNKVLDFHNSS